MERKSAAEEAGTEATNPNKQTPGSKPRKTPAQKKKHNEQCKKSRAKIKRRREELEQKEIEYLEMISKYEQSRTENESMKKEIEQIRTENESMKKKIKQIRTENERIRTANERLEEDLDFRVKEMQALRIDLQKYRQMQELNGQNFSSFSELQNYLLSPINEHVGQVSGTSATVVHDANQLPRLGATGTDNIHPSLADFYQSMGFGASSAANHGLPFGSDASDNHDNGVLIDSAVGSSPGANQYLTAFDAPNYDNLFTDILAAGAAGSSFQPNLNPSIQFDATNNPENIHDLFNHAYASGFPF